MNYTNMVALVTGGGRGIGKAYVVALLERGVKVCIAELNDTTGKETEQELEQKYGKGKVIFVKTDVSNYESYEKAIQRTISVFGKLDILINNAAYFSEQNWEKTIAINMVGVIYGIKLAFEYMGKDKGHNGGYVINMASKAGIEANYMAPVYSSTKFAVVGATRSFGSDFFKSKHGVTVNAICPGCVDTIPFRTYTDIALDPVGAKELCDSFVPINPSDVAVAMIKLLEDGRNGACIRIYEDNIPQYLD